jgi:glycosyltransferase involved in cell wall biosynthesis
VETLKTGKKVIFVHRNQLGAPGEAAMYYYPRLLAEKGYIVKILALAEGKDIFSESSVEVLEISPKQNWLTAVRDVILKEQPNVVHIFLYSGAGLVPLITKTKCTARFVLDIRSPLLRTGLSRVLHRLKNLFEPILFDAIAAHSLDSAKTQVGMLKDVKFLPPGVDLTMALPSFDSVMEANFETKTLRTVYIGSLDRLRKPIEMIRAFSLASKQCSVQLDIFGDGSEKEFLESYVISHGLSDVIYFHGVISRTELFKALTKFDLGIAYVPGGLYEVAPALKTLEYMACSLPVLATRTLGNQLFVVEDINGILADEEPEYFSQAIIDVAANRDLKKLRKNARPSVEKYDWNMIVEQKLIKLYDELHA